MRPKNPYIPRSPDTLEDGLQNHIRSSIAPDNKPKTLEEAFDEVWRREDGDEDDEDEEEEIRIFINPHRES